MITFFPGPSRVYTQVRQYLIDAYDSGILSISHRSERFNELSAETVNLLKQNLKIPDDYQIFYTSSATECWEIVAQSFTNQHSHHLYSGSFGEKWYAYANKLKPGSKAYVFDINTDIEHVLVQVSGDKPEVLCLTQNETSNATQIPVNYLPHIRQMFPHSLIAYDATSSMAGIKLPFSLGDIWFASVQKCFGLPAGMGLLICSPNAIQKAIELGENQHYNSATLLIEHMKKYQTSYTPNVLAIYLLNRVLSETIDMEQHETMLKHRATRLYEWLENSHRFTPLVTNITNRSTTVVAVQGTEAEIKSIKQLAKEHGLLLGAGYGPWKEHTFRIANFPAIENKEFDQLIDFLTKYA